MIAPSRGELDLQDPLSLSRFTAKHALLGVDILVNNAGVNVINPLGAITEEDWRQMYEVNLHAPFRLIQAFAPGMKSRGWGRVVNVSSVWSLVTKDKRAAYSAMKSGLNGLTR